MKHARQARMWELLFLLSDLSLILTGTVLRDIVLLVCYFSNCSQDFMCGSSMVPFFWILVKFLENAVLS